MALKSISWFEGESFFLARRMGAGTELAIRALELAFNVDNTRGHVLQAVGSVQEFLNAYPQHIAKIRVSPYEPYKMTGQMLANWLAFIASKQGSYGRKDFKFNWTYFKNALTSKYGGNTTGGGGGDNEFEIVLRLVAEFI